MYYKCNPAKLQIAKSRISGGGYGVFAKGPIRKDEVLEVSPFIEIPKKFVFNQSKSNLLQNYVFISHCKPNHVLIVFGYGSIYNHSNTKPNVYYRINQRDRKRFLDFVAMEDILPGTELLINYGPNHQANKISK